MENRFRVLLTAEAKKVAPDDIGRWAEDFEGHLFDFSTDPPKLIASDRSEPEDVSFYRDYAWVPTLLNKLEDERQALEDKLQACYEEAAGEDL